MSSLVECELPTVEKMSCGALSGIGGGVETTSTGERAASSGAALLGVGTIVGAVDANEGDAAGCALTAGRNTSRGGRAGRVGPVTSGRSGPPERIGASMALA